MNSSTAKNVIAFGAGVAAWEAVVHFSLLVNRAQPRLFGIRMTRRLNTIQSIVPALCSMALIRYAFGGSRQRPISVPHDGGAER